MLPRWTSLLALFSLTGIGLLSYDLLSARPTLPEMVGLALVTLTSLGYALSLRQMRRSAFQSVMSTYADRQMRQETRSPLPTFDAPSTAV